MAMFTLPHFICLQNIKPQEQNVSLLLNVSLCLLDVVVVVMLWLIVYI